MTPWECDAGEKYVAFRLRISEEYNGSYHDGDMSDCIDHPKSKSHIAPRACGILLGEGLYYGRRSFSNRAACG